MSAASWGPLLLLPSYLYLCLFNQVKVLIQELVRCGASPEFVRNILQCVSKVHPKQSAKTSTLYQETLQQLMTSAIHGQSSSSGSHDNNGSPDETDGAPASSNYESNESVTKIFAAVADHETGGCVLDLLYFLLVYKCVHVCVCLVAL